MKISRLDWTPFRLPLRKRFVAAHGSLTYREGILVRVAVDSGLAGLGEASPHPALSSSRLQDIAKELEYLKPHWLGEDIERLALLGIGDISPALACAVDAALFDILARARGQSVAEALCDGTPPRSVPVNATIAAATTADAVAEAVEAVRSGFRCLKLKVGAPDPAEDIERVEAVRKAAGPATKLRLDANGAWDVTTAIEAIRALAPLDIELVEQPVSAADLAGLARVRAAVGVPIAADEPVTSPEAAVRILEAGGADILVIKPMVVGGLRPARRIIEMAVKEGKRCLVTTTIDSTIGTAAALHLAASLPQPPLACGLATTQLLAGDLARTPLTIESGCMGLPASPGLGVILNEKALAQFTIDLPSSDLPSRHA